MTELVVKDPRPVIRGTAAWALGQIGTSEGIEAIGIALREEEDPEVRIEMEKVLETN